MTDLPGDSTTSGWTDSRQLAAGPAARVVYSGFWIRVVAWIIDALVLGVLTSALAPVTGSGMLVEATQSGVNVNYGANALGTLVGLVYFIGFWVWRGQTPGMMPFRMRVVRADDGGSIDIGRALLRYVGLIISFVVLFLGVIWVAFDSRKQGWHDKIAGTLVVRPG